MSGDYGDGSIYESGGRWYAEWTVPEGERKGERKKFSAKTKREVRRRLAAYKEEVARGATLGSPDERTDEYLVWWFKTVHTTDRVRPSTRKTEYYFLAHIADILGAVKLRDLKPDHLDVLYAGLRERGLAVSSCRTIISVFRKAIKDAVRRERLQRDPFQFVDPIKEEETTEERLSLSLAQAQMLLHETERDELGALWVLLLTTGLRIGEALAVRWKDLEHSDVLGDLLYVRRTVTRDEDGSQTMGPPKTRKSRGAVPLMSLCIDALAEHRTQQKIDRLAAPAWEDNDLVFPRSDGTPMHTDYPRRELCKVAERLGLPHTTPHTLRHSLSRIFRDQGIDPLVARDVLRHQSVEMTMGTYGHLGLDERRRAINDLGQILSGEKRA